MQSLEDLAKTDVELLEPRSGIADQCVPRDAGKGQRAGLACDSHVSTRSTASAALAVEL